MSFTVLITHIVRGFEDIILPLSPSQASSASSKVKFSPSSRREDMPCPNEQTCPLLITVSMAIQTAIFREDFGNSLSCHAPDHQGE